MKVHIGQEVLKGLTREFYSPQAAPLTLREDFTSCRIMDFPSDFVWGTATASFQVEGGQDITETGRGKSIWDDFAANAGRVANGDTGAVADDFYHKYKADIALMASMGIKNFRLSFSWSRILPDGTPASANPKGIAFYNDLINTLLANGITPWVTLFHWDLPSAL